MKRVRFGAFEADLESGELRKHGVRIRLQEQPFKILAALLVRPGELVSREDLVARLWPDGTYVDFDRGLNAAVNRLRQALADSAENPRYVETVARRGYRFIASVATEPATAEDSSMPAAEPRDPAAGHRSRSPLWVAAAATVTLIVAAGWALRPRSDSTPTRTFEAVPLTTYDGTEQHSTFSPDGTQVAFSWNGRGQDNYDIYVKALGSDSARRLTTDPAPELHPNWSPDGRYIAFQRAGHGVYLIAPTGGAERRLLAPPDFGKARLERSLYDYPGDVVSWSPDGQFLAFARPATQTEPGGVFLIPVQGGATRRITTAEPPEYHHSPAFSPDARAIALAKCTGQPCSIGAISLDKDLRPLGPVRIVASQSSSRIDGIAWTADGQSVVFSEDTYGLGTRLWRTAATDGSKPERLGFAAAGSAYPVIGHRASRLAYTLLISDFDIWRIESASATRTMSSTRNDNSPQFSPDGTRVAFASNRSGRSEIWVAGADGSNPVQLTSSRASGTPRWSPDGRFIVYDTQDEAGSWDVNVLDAASGASKPLVTHPADDAAPSFSRDGKWIYFASRRSGELEVYRVPASGGDPIKLTENGAMIAFESIDGQSVYYSKSNLHCGTPLFVRPVAGGPEREILPSVCARAFAVTELGIYYIAGLEPDRTLRVMLFNPSTGKTTEAGRTDRPLENPLTLAVSPANGAILLGARIQTGADLYLVESFR